MISIKKERVFSLERGQIVVAVVDGKKKSFFTKGLGFPGDTEREFQIKELGSVDEFLLPIAKEVTSLLDAQLNKVE